MLSVLDPGCLFLRGIDPRKKMSFLECTKMEVKNCSTDFETMWRHNESESDGVRCMTGESFLWSVSVNVSGVYMCLH